jgi:hypothetical protein
MPTVTLIGYRGTGKSTVAAVLARRLECRWWDADVESIRLDTADRLTQGRGSRGIVVYRYTTDTFVAFDRHSTYDIAAGCQVQVSDDGTSVVVTLPPAYLTDPTFDRELSHVMNRDRGLLDRIGSMFSDNPTSEEGLYDAADQKITAAAAATDLQARAEANTTVMLETMLRSMGFEQVEVRFQQSSASVA